LDDEIGRRNFNKKRSSNLFRDLGFPNMLAFSAIPKHTKQNTENAKDNTYNIHIINLSTALQPTKN